MKTTSLRYAAIVLVLALAAFRLAHVHLLWADEDYHLAAAIQILNGKIPYRDFWYDKPPLSALYYLLIGGFAGWPLRLLDLFYILSACLLLFQLARLWWSELEAWIAALLFAFFTTFYLPSAIIPFAADAVMLVPHLSAIYCAALRKPLWTGVFCGVAFFANPKALFVFATCAVWLLPDLLALCAAFSITAGMGWVALWGIGAWDGYVEQVWRWGLRYAVGSPVTDPFRNGLLRTLNWVSFHAALLFGSVAGMLAIEWDKKKRLGVWIAFSFFGVALGSRFAPHYFLQLLPSLVLVSARGVVVLFRARPRIASLVFTAALLVPAIRFGPRYFMLAANNLRGQTPGWIDVAMDLDSQRVANFINARKHAGDTLFVWGYRPDVYVDTRLIPRGLFWDSQPITGVAADRHLFATTTIYRGAAVRNRRLLSLTKPTWLVDGLGLLNPALQPSAYPDLRSWLAAYELAGKTKLSVIYRRR